MRLQNSLTYWGQTKQTPFRRRHFQMHFLNENVWIPIPISSKFIPMGAVNKVPALVQIMAWHRPGDKPLSKPMMVSLLTHICVTRPQWVEWHSHVNTQSRRFETLRDLRIKTFYLIFNWTPHFSHSIIVGQPATNLRIYFFSNFIIWLRVHIMCFRLQISPWKLVFWYIALYFCLQDYEKYLRGIYRKWK